MQHLAKDHFVYSMDKAHAPALTITSGEQIKVDTYDCFEDQIQSETHKMDSMDWNRINPATGPIYVENSEPGDVLKVHIDDIILGDQGVMLTGPDLGVMGHRMEDFKVKILPLQDGKVVFDEKLALPLNPMIGVIGVAPEGEGVNCGTPDSHGGNMDTKRITKGATLYFPVFQKGALLSLGDLHAAMGDGEISVSGVEIPAEVKLTVEVLKTESLPYPMLEDEEGITTIVSKKSLDDAVDSAVEMMIDRLHPHVDLSLSELTMLMSAAGQVEVSQVVDPLKTARFFVPRYVLDAYDINLF
ncbi:acetamidase/formamidase family protein [Salimicrobium flavidum]|uniref:Amidase n=1 Tax=Salimicrobium flavidum TaxID=570947 RepID=A0A1N7IZJ1_9BACI|nr:acetamidase/formamidase family protein [Salimicrobium flavidum]SIS42552.1 amidase [Salimicrobium flavidum]